MTNGDDEIIRVDWDSKAWEEAIGARDDIGRAGGDGDWVLFSPGRLIVDIDAAGDDRVRRQLERGKARRSDSEQARAIEPLGLWLYETPDDSRDDEALVETTRAIRAIVPNAASLDHVWIPGPNTVHGDDVPEPTDDPGDIPGPSAAGDDMTVVVLDTGIAEVPFPAESDGGDAEVPDSEPDKRRDPAAGHGTHVAGIVARHAPNARIVARRLLQTAIGMASEIDTIVALEKAAGSGKHVIINCSFGGPTAFDAPPLATERALERLPAGVVVVAAAGNSGTERPNWPAASKRVVAVGAVGRDESAATWRRADFSNFGAWVDCCAPGVDVASTFLHWKSRNDPVFEGFATWTGTSFAAPLVSAMIAARASTRGIPPAQAVYELIDDPALARIPRIGTLVVP